MDEAKLVAQFRERLTSRLEELGVGQSGLASAFEEADVAGEGELTVKQLSHVLFTLNFHASKARTYYWPARISLSFFLDAVGILQKGILQLTRRAGLSQV